MDERIEAIYENGVFKPLAKVSLPEGARVVLIIENFDVEATLSEAEIVARQRHAAALLDEQLRDVPYSTHSDGLSSEDHDQILYGGKGDRIP